MNLAIGVVLSSSVTPVEAVVSPRSYHILPVFLMTETLVPAGKGLVNLIYELVPSTLNSASTLISAVGLLAPKLSLYASIGSFLNLEPPANTSIWSQGPLSVGMVDLYQVVLSALGGKKSNGPINNELPSLTKSSLFCVSLYGMVSSLPRSIT